MLVTATHGLVDTIRTNTPDDNLSSGFAIVGTCEQAAKLTSNNVANRGFEHITSSAIAWNSHQIGLIVEMPGDRRWAYRKGAHKASATRLARATSVE